MIKAFYEYELIDEITKPINSSAEYIISGVIIKNKLGTYSYNFCIYEKFLLQCTLVSILDWFFVEDSKGTSIKNNPRLLSLNSSIIREEILPEFSYLKTRREILEASIEKISRLFLYVCEGNDIRNSKYHIAKDMKDYIMR